MVVDLLSSDLVLVLDRKYMPIAVVADSIAVAEDDNKAAVTVETSLYLDQAASLAFAGFSDPI